MLPGRALARAIVLGLLVWSSVVAAEVVVERLAIQQPRTFGYQIGDKFARTISLRLRKPYHLTADALPAPGRLTEWLAIEAPQVVQKNGSAATQYEIRLTYQLVNINPRLLDLAVPPHLLRYTDGQETLKVLIPATRISASLLHQGTDGDLQPDRQPWPLRFPVRKPILLGSLFLSSLLGVAYLYWGAPLLTEPRPFMAASRKIRRARQQPGANHPREALQIIHQAFNETAGKTVFADTLGDFFESHAQFSPARQPITDFFLRSRKVFYAEEMGGDEQESLREITAFVQRCSDLERGLG